MKIVFGLLFFALTLPAQGMVFQIEKVTNHHGHTMNLVYLLGTVDNMDGRRWIDLPNELDLSLDTLFILNSPGGTVPTGLFTIKKVEEFIVNQEEKNHKSWIIIDGQCASMCVPLFFAWPHRFAVKDTKIGLHGVSSGPIGYNAEDTSFYLKNMLENAEARGESGAINWLHQKISNGEFWSTDLTKHLAQDVARENGLLSSDGIVDSIPQLIDQL